MLEQRTSWEIFLLFFFTLVLPLSPAPAAVNVMIGVNDPSGLHTTHPPHSDVHRGCHPHNVNKQERDPFLPTVTQTWNPAPSNPLFPPPLQGESSTRSAVFHILSDSCEEKKEACEKSNSLKLM